MVLVPIPLILPVLSQILAVAAAAVAGWAWLRSGATSTQLYWDISGLLAFLSCLAAVVGEPEHLLLWLELERPD